MGHVFRKKSISVKHPLLAMTFGLACLQIVGCGIGFSFEDQSAKDAGPASSLGIVPTEPRPVGSDSPGSKDKNLKVYTVNSNSDSGDNNPGDGKCENVQGKCTLRAAIEEINASKGSPDKKHKVQFEVNLAPLMLRSEIKITRPVVIKGNSGNAQGKTVFGRWGADPYF